MMKKDIVMVLNYAPAPNIDKDNDRVLSIIDLLVSKGFDVELVTSDFSHGDKKPKDIAREDLDKLNYKYTMLHEPPYYKNVSIKRFLAHARLAKNVGKYLEKRKKPDLIFTVTTSTAVGYVAAKYAKKNDIPLVIDVQDLWPEAFKMIIPVKSIADVLFFREQQKANFIYRSADGIVGVSHEYVDRALKENNHINNGLSVYLGTSLDRFDSYAEQSSIVKPDSEFWVVYIGTLGTSYNIKGIIDSFVELKKKGRNDIKLKVLGDGPLKNEFVEYAKDKAVECEFLGLMPYSEMVKYIVKCDIAVNPIVSTSAASIINKVADYAAAGLPVISTLRSKEYKDLLVYYNAGYSFDNNQHQEIAQAIEKLADDSELCKTMGEGSRKLAEELFDRKKTYPSIVDMIEKLSR